jgi:hypothetical protein
MKSWSEPAYTLPQKYSKLTTTQRRHVREQYIKEQNNLCYWCKHSLDEDPPSHILEKRISPTLFPVNFFRHSIHLHHDHISDLTEGAVHAYCNAVMYQYYNR